MSARAKNPTERGKTKPPPIPARPSLDDQKTEIFDSGNFKKETATPIKAISMKTPDHEEDAKRERAPVRKVHQVKLRAISDVKSGGQAQPQNLGNLAPPRDASEVRARRTQDYVIWGCMAVIFASVVALVIWFVAR